MTNCYHPEPAGSGPPITDLSFWLAEQGLAVDVLTTRPSYPRRQVFEDYRQGQRDREQVRSVNVRRLASAFPVSRGAIGRLASEASFAVSVMLRRRAYPSVIAVCPSILAVLAAPLFRARSGRVVAIVHDIQSGLARTLRFGLARIFTNALRRLEAAALNRCDAVIALTDAMAHELGAMGIMRPITVLPPQVDVTEITPLPEPANDPPIVAYSGNLGRKQGLDQLLVLAEELHRRGSIARLLIRGEGSERARLERLARARGLGNIDFADLAPRPGLSEAMGLATVHLAPQDPDGANFAFPSKVFTIMAARRAYVATAFPNTPLEIVTRQSGGGLCVPPDEPKLLADAVETLLADTVLRTRLAASGRRYVEQVADREVVCCAILDVVRGQASAANPSERSAVQASPAYP